MVGAATLWWLALPPRGWWVLFPLGTAAFMLALAGRPLRERLWLGALGGVVHYGMALRWLTDFTGAGYLAVVALETALLVLVAAVSFAVPTRAGTITGQHVWPGWWLATPAALVLLEAVQNRFPFGGFPLPSLGFSQVDGPFMGAAPLGGSLLVTGLAALTGAAGVALVVGSSRTRAAAAVSVVLAVAVPPAVPDAVGTAASGTLDAAIVQGGGARGVHVIQSVDATAEHLRAARGITGSPDLVLMPESIAHVEGPIGRTSVGARFADLARRLGTNLVVGTTEAEGRDRFRNASLLWGPEGNLLGRYEKHHRVPFGEYLPLRDLVEPLSDLTRLVPRDAIAGRGPAVLEPRGVPPMGIVISYETFFADRVAAAVRAGGQLVLAPTSASSFTGQDVPAIEVAASRLRAKEFGRTVLQAAPTGYSAIIRPDGALTELSGLGTRELLSASVPLRTGMTPYARMGDTPMLALLLLIALLSLHALRRRAV
ncbi:apolipoprotein N-acyltransferase [Janibacter cremeus]|uniref:apolipoprotein N-acyltransferase n=1 Tax=Janibacter cremeus TaxID=1285192 RepID=UPI0023F81BEA|nr:apolipoprotein N-acyltransferase [Janibacter cremeus]WEV78929.1 apolipoprotein N-acyltransferase [Janibacter cremeus]